MGMKEYDIIVVGGGPAGCAAAKIAAEKGVKVIVLEEHPAIGIPRHCTGIFPDSGYSSEILSMVGEGIVIQKLKLTRVYAPSGKILQEIPVGDRGCAVIRREEFDMAWAKLAANAGAEIVLSTRVTGILKGGGEISGVTTNSTDMPEVKGKLVIAAGGYHAMRSGITKQEGLGRPGDEFFTGVQMELTNVKDIEPNVCEIAYGSLSRRGCILIVPVDENSCLTNFRSLEEFKEFKAGSHIFCKRLRDAIPLRMMGYISPVYYGRCLPKTIKNGLILVGSAAGINGMVSVVLTGGYAGEVAAEAIKEGDTTEVKLSRYEVMWKALGLEHEYDFWVELMRTVHRLPDEALEKSLKEMVKRGEELMFRMKLTF